MSGREPGWIEALSENWSGPLQLRVRGRSMWPTLQPGDQVTVEPATVDDLRPGDWVLLEGQEGLFLHRLLGFDKKGALLTKGDGHRAPDAPWPPQALRGRAVALSRQGQTIPISSSSMRERVKTIIHRLMATAWSLVRRAGFLILLFALTPAIAKAAVELISFEATPTGKSVRVTWVTASEVDMLGFDLQRATAPDAEYLSIVFVWAEGEIVGASYEHIDTDVEFGQTYYYRLEAVETDEDSEFHGPISVTIPFPTPTPPSAPPPPPPAATSTPTPTRGPTSTPPTGTPPTSTPTRTPTPTPTPTRTATRTPTRTPMPGGDDENTPTETAPSTSTQTPAAEQATVIATIVSEPGIDSAGATATFDIDLTSQSTKPPALIAQATAISPTASGRPQPSPSPDSSEPRPTRSTAEGRDSSSPWGLVLALITAGGVLILLGGLGLWWMRQKK
ncbi:MAG: S24/S26 family peptidase [Anaerolineae bacterium]|nr:S24/S26 family peptidase [Anaerolineae bacterium]